MQLPNLLGNFPNHDIAFFIAADENYFNRHAIPLINSIKTYFSYPIHFHLYNPSDFTKNFCSNNSISFSYEYFDTALVEPAFRYYKIPLNDNEIIRRRSRMIKNFNNTSNLYNDLVKTYYACVRFIRLYQLLSKPTYIIMLDTDSLVRKNFELPNKDFDIHIYEKNNDKNPFPYPQHLASTIFYTGTDESYKLIRNHALILLDEFNKDTYYWFLDQETLDKCLIYYKTNNLDKSFVDFNMENDSYIWCAKGLRKNKPIWIQETLKYHKLSK